MTRVPVTPVQDAMPSTVAYATSARRVALSICVGVVCGGLAYALTLFAASQLWWYLEPGGPDPVLSSSVIGGLVCAAGFVAAAPIWFCLHRINLRQWWAATLLGALLGSVACALASFGRPDWADATRQLLKSGDGVEIFLFIQPPVLGALIGATTWFVAYRRSRPSIYDVF